MGKTVIRLSGNVWKEGEGRGKKGRGREGKR
jgi:hypothetical protein